MSHYSEIALEIKSVDCLLEALQELLNIDKSKIEIHDTPQALYDYRSTARPQTAHIIIRKEYVGSASNDMGVKRNDDGTYTLIVDEYSMSAHGYGAKWVNKLKQKYATKITLKALNAQGLMGKVKEEKVGNKIKISVTV